nr:AraC family transcriptional regulator [Parvularcula mediterranea]
MELEDLLETSGRSQRQLERLCKAYFGGSPKKLHRKFRALHAANAFAWDEHQDWRDVASTTYYDQAHFIREFKTFNGRTPTEFINGPHFLVRVTLDQRRQIDHPSPYSLIG